MSSPHSLARTRRLLIASGICMLVGAGILSAGADAAIGAGSGTAAGSVGGRVFLDYNDDGVADANETQGPGATPVTVRAYDAAGDLVGETATAADGTYTLSYTAAASDALRIEFVEIPSWLEPAAQGAGSNTSVQFVTGPTAVADFAVHDPQDYCQNNPELAVACFAKYGPDATTEAGAPSVRLFPYDSGTTEVAGRPAGYGDPANTTGAEFGDTGSVYGEAWNAKAGRLYLGAYARRFVEMGPAGAHGIYMVDPTTKAVTTFFSDAALDATLPDRSSFSDVPLVDPWSNDVVSKASWGDLEVVGNRLFAVNLTNRSLYAWNLAADGSAIGAPIVVAIPNYAQNAADNRPFSLGYSRGTLFVGGVDSAETSGLSANLDGWVTSLDPTTLAFKHAAGVGNEAFRFDLNYARGCAWRTGSSCAMYTRHNASNGSVAAFAEQPRATFGAWAAQTSYYQDPSGATFTVQPMPVLSDLAFDDDGSLIIGLRDRHGDLSLGAYQVGRQCNFNPFVPGGYDCSVSSSVSGAGWPFGDVLRANVNGAGNTSWTIAATDHYNGDHALLSGGGGSLMGHDQSDIGALYAKPGTGEVATTAYDTFSSWSGDLGVRWHTGPADWPSQTSPDRTSRAYTAFEGCMSLNDCPQPFRKNNGLGDLEALCDQAPIEIGNRVWLDENDNGVQDASELPIAGVTVEIRRAGVLIGSTVTAADGTYYFGGVTNRSLNPGESLTADTAYDVTIPNAEGASQQSPLVGLSLTTAHATATSADADLADSDATLVGNDAVAPFSTGRSGANNHTYDFGFVTPVVTTTTTIPSTTTQPTTTTAVTTTTQPTTTTAVTTTTQPTTTTAVTTTTQVTTTSTIPTATTVPSTTTQPTTTTQATTTTQPTSTTTQPTSTTTQPSTTTTGDLDIRGNVATTAPRSSVAVQGALPMTGSPVTGLLVLGGGLIAAGLLVGRVGRRRTAS